MAEEVKFKSLPAVHNSNIQGGRINVVASPEHPLKPPKSKSRSRDKESVTVKRRCVSTACIACRRRKSKCDGSTPSCAACESVYGTQCIYDPNSDHRRKGVYKKDIDNLKTHNSTLQTLIEAILNYPESEIPELVRQIRTCESLDDVAGGILARDSSPWEALSESDPSFRSTDAPIAPKFEKELSGKMRELRLENGTVQSIGGTSNLIYLDSDQQRSVAYASIGAVGPYKHKNDAITSWTTVTPNATLVDHLMQMYMTWHYTYFTTISKHLFLRDFHNGRPAQDTGRETEHCTPLLVNAMLAIGCHFSSWPEARSNPDDSATAGDHFFKEAKRLILVNDEHEKPRLATVQALALMSVREAGCGREAKGWVYSGMSFRMACDLGLDVDSGNASLAEDEVDARRITLWGCFLFDKCWSNYLGRPPQLPLTNITVPKFDVFPFEDSEPWYPWTDSGSNQTFSQPARTRAIALQISLLCEISSDLLFSFYHPTHVEKPVGKNAELKRLGEIHTRLEAWYKNLPREFEAREGQLPNVLIMHMFFHLLYIHLFRPFLKYSQGPSPPKLPVPPKRQCVQAAEKISKYLRIYKRSYGLRQICNIAVYIAHSACTIHLLNLPDKNARRDIVHGVRQLEEIAEGWLCARKTLGILSAQARKWNIELPAEAATVLSRTDAKFGYAASPDPQSPKSDTTTALEAQQSTSYVPISRITTAPFSFPNVLPSTGASVVVKPNYGESATSGDDMTTSTASAPLAAVSTKLSNPHNQEQYLLSHTQRDLWNQDRVRRKGNAETYPSPTEFFGGVPALVDDSGDTQQWWLKEDNQSLFENWGKTDPVTGLVSGDANDAIIDMTGMNGMNIGMDGMNGFGRSDDPDGPGFGGFVMDSYGVSGPDAYQ